MMVGDLLDTPLDTPLDNPLDNVVWHGFVEVSQACVDPAYRGRGWGEVVTAAVAAGVRDGGDLPYLHVLTANTTAIRLYQRLGFHTRVENEVVIVQRVP